MVIDHQTKAQGPEFANTAERERSQFCRKPGAYADAPCLVGVDYHIIGSQSISFEYKSVFC